MKMAGKLVGFWGSVVIGWLTYIDNTFSPLFWALLILAGLDLFFNVHKGYQQQLSKLASMAVSMGIPTYFVSNMHSPDIGKWMVAVLVIMYLRVVVPDAIAWIKSLKLSNDPKTDAADKAALEAKVEELAAKVEAQAAKEQKVIE